MTEVVLFHMLAATAGTAFGLLAIWAGLGRLHWSVRFIPVAAVIVAMFPVPAFDLALVFLSQALVVAVPLILVRRFRPPPAAGTAIATPPAAHPWRRFSVADLFRSTLLIAAVFGVVAYLPEDVRKSWWKHMLVGAGFGVATLAGTWAALPHQRRWFRFGVVCILVPLAGVPTVLYENVLLLWGSGWLWCAVTASVALLVATWLCLAHYAGFGRMRHADDSPAGHAVESRATRGFRRRLAISGLALVSLAILLLPTVAYYEMLHVPPIPITEPPEPNAYDDLLRIAAALQNVDTPVASLATEAEQQASAGQRRRVLFDELHAALRRSCAVPFRRPIEDSGSYLPQLQSLRQLSRDLLADGDRHRLAGNTIEAQRSYLDLVELGLAISRDGLLVDRLVGIAFEGMGIEGLRQLRDALSNDQRRTLIAALQVHEAGWEPSDDVNARELFWLDRMIGWPVRISFANPIDNIPTQAAEQADSRRSAMLKLLICELALAQYAADHGAPPAQLAELAPNYLPKVPDDPFSELPMVYRTEPAGYVLYSVGQNGADDGGQRSRSITDGDLFLDPASPESDGAGEN